MLPVRVTDGIERRLGLADLGGGLGQPALGGAHVGPGQQHVGRQAGPQRQARRRDGRDRGEAAGQRRRLAAGEHAQAMHRLGIGDLQGRDVRFGGGGLGGGLGDVDRRGRAGVELALGEGGGLALRGGGAPRQRDAGLVAAGLDIIGGDVADQRQQRGVEIVPRGIRGRRWRPRRCGGWRRTGRAPRRRRSRPGRGSAACRRCRRRARPRASRWPARERVTEAEPSTVGNSAPMAWRRSARASRTLALAVATSRLPATASSISADSMGSRRLRHQRVRSVVSVLLGAAP